MRSTIVDPELRHWARGAFRPATMSGDLHRMRARELARREGGDDTVYFAVAGVLALGGGFLLGRWWKRRQATNKPSPYVAGVDVLGAH